MVGTIDLAAAGPQRLLPSHVSVAIPVRGEAERLDRVLSVLTVAAERSPCLATALVLANNCTDDTAAIARARRLAMDLA
ncbi:hypothetical protein EYF88_16490 [Paracoccus sediminis]|uniref:Glycosyl transferase family 2 n=1 Tax=Paracoccus sediminis TaxID=1214787 RepID=A0A238YH04_9RHOB|nr:hypothetical protein [Paracoccus sediminis]TBN46649.1 hypothetical protein EYF88_16490 [Paracoccus sediminis]SNR70350.1 hypothetical protein SAMN06265378_11846 [Paracoccus sediminis]